MAKKKIEHAERAHAMLSPSGSSKWLACTPSVILEQNSGIESKESPYAKEGTLAHELADLELKLALNFIDSEQYKADISEIIKSEFYNDSFVEDVDAYVQNVLASIDHILATNSSVVILIEDSIKIDEYTGEKNAKGTGDVIIIADHVLYVKDLKFGRGVKVSTVDNSQLKIYGLGALHKYGLMYDIKTVHLEILQPRIYNYSSFSLSAEELIEWGETVVRPTAKKALLGEGELVAGDHCKFCKVKPKCKAAADKNLSVAKHEFADPMLMTDEQVIQIYSVVDSITDWLKSVKDYVKDSAVNGKQWPGYKLVNGRSQRKIVDEEGLLVDLTLAGYAKSEIVTEKIIGITALEKLVGKKVFEANYSEYVEKPQGAPTLVPVEDGRTALGKEQAKLDFKD